MRALISILMVAVAALAPTPSVSGAAAASGEVYYAVDVSLVGPRVLRELRSDPGVESWYELGDVLVIAGTSGSRNRAAAKASVSDVESPRPGEQLFVTRHVHPNDIERIQISRPGGRAPRMLASSGLYGLVAAKPEDMALLDDGHDHANFIAAETGVTVARSAVNDVRPIAPASSSKLSKLNSYADSVDPARWHASVATLAGFRTRYVGTQGVADARDYLAAQFRALGLSVETPEFNVGSRKAQNVVAELRGTTRPDELYIVCGHYDSISEQATTLAPGAEDNASGAAGVLELARVLSSMPPQATVRFIAFSGEEAGLYGSWDYVRRAVSNGESRRVRAVINMDMIGFSRDDDLDVLLETSTVGGDLVDVLAEAATAVTDLRVVTSFYPFGSDHVPFLDANIPTVLTIENDWSAYRDYHTSRDVIENVRVDMGGQILRMNAAALGLLAGEPPGPEPSLSMRVPFATNRTTVYGGFVLPIDWTASGDGLTTFDVEASLDDGATWSAVVTGLPADRRAAYWTVPADARSSRAFLRVSARFEDGSALVDTSVPLVIKPSNGPKIQSVKFKTTINGDLIVRGRFGDDFQRIEVNGVPLPATAVEAKFIDGNTTTRMFGVAQDLDAFFPRGVTVRVRVVDGRTGLATPELAVKR
ncbi:MAG: DUF4910 domain-containing protein [Blastocatellia bacterium]|nr:DUF4910 domain-containing protein [Blastocatellia bacterium]